MWRCNKAAKKVIHSGTLRWSMATSSGKIYCTRARKHQTSTCTCLLYKNIGAVVMHLSTACKNTSAALFVQYSTFHRFHSQQGRCTLVHKRVIILMWVACAGNTRVWLTAEPSIQLCKPSMQYCTTCCSSSILLLCFIVGCCFIVVESAIMLYMYVIMENHMATNLLRGWTEEVI